MDSQTSASTQTLYQRLLGRDFERLPPVLQRFHSLPGGVLADGVISVQRGSGVLRQIAAGLLRLPEAGEDVPLRLQTVPRNGREIWIRHFNGQPLETVQWQEGPYLVEKAGPLCFVFQLSADEHGLTFHPRANKTQGLQLPEHISLRINANTRGTENCWHIEVIIAAPLLGTVTTYRGEITPRSC